MSVSLTDSQTINGHDAKLAAPKLALNLCVKWAILGKQDWRCGMNRMSG